MWSMLDLKKLLGKITKAIASPYAKIKAPANYTFDATTTTRLLILSITTNGRPVFIACSGDINPITTSAWMNIRFYRDSTLLSHQIAQSNAESQNIPFCMIYLDTPPAGSYTYKVEFTRGAGDFTLSENGAMQAPNFVVFEI